MNTPIKHNMNTENDVIFSEESPVFPEAANTQEASQIPQQRERHWLWPLIWLLIFLALAVLWSYCCGGCVKGSGNGNGSAAVGSGSGGSGSGTNTSGDGPGAGTSGTGSGDKKTAPAQPAPGSSSTSDKAGSGSVQKNDNADKTAGSGKDSVKKLPPVKQIEYLTSVVTKPVPTVGAASSGNLTGRKGFYGVDTRGSTRSIFIVDTSGSMGAGSMELPGKSRVDILKLELIKSIFGSGKKTVGGFVILSFNSTVRRFPAEKLCRYRNAKSMNEARNFIDNLFPGGGTEMRPVWETALKIAAEEKIDTIYFMTDGMPMDNFNEHWLLPQLKHLGKLKIHCIAVGIQKDFMKEIAKATGGEYIYIP